MPYLTYAQSVTLKGKVINTDNQSVEYSNVILSKNRKAMVQGLTDSLGRFSLSYVAGDYTLLVKQFDYVFFKRAIRLNQNTDLGEIRINNAVVLEGVSIRGRKKWVERLVDRVVYNVENKIAFLGADAFEVLKKIPGIRILDDQISLVGKSKVMVLINEKPTLLSGESLLHFLQSLQAGALSKIEVITNPTAKYSAEGNSGIINIVLKEAKPNYWSASLSSSYTQKTYDQKKWGGNFNYQKNKLSFLSSLDFVIGSRQIYYSNKYYYAKQTWRNNNPTRVFGKSMVGRIGIDYTITKNWLMGIQCVGNRESSPMESNRKSEIVNSETKELNAFYNTLSNTKRKNTTLALNFSNKFVLDGRKRTLYIGLDYFYYSLTTDNNFTTNFYAPNGAIVSGRRYSANNFGNQGAYNFSMQTDVDFPSQWIDLKLGGRTSFTINNSDVSLYNTTSGKPILAPSQTSVFEYKEHTQALYITGNKVFSTKLEGQIGLRWENTQTTGNSLTLSQINYNRYGRLFPTLFLSYKPDSIHVFNINYGKRIQRPSYADMNPFRWYDTNFSYTEGNPFLQPSFSDNLEWSYTYKSNFSNTLYFSRLDQGFSQVSIIENNTEAQITIPKNFIKSFGIGFSSSYIFDKINCWTSINSLDLSYASAQSEIKITNQKQSGLCLSLSTSNDLNLNKNKTALFNISYSYSTSGAMGLYKFSPSGALDMAFKFFLLDKTWQLSLVGNDLFKTDITTLTAYTNDIKQEYRNYYDQRLFRIALSYNFGGKNSTVKKKIFDNAEEQSRFN